MPRIDLVGQRFGRLTAVEVTHVKGGQCYWLCRCDCGAATITRSEFLRTGYTQSCGCLRIDRITAHGRRGSRSYSSWSNMKQRCLNPRNAKYSAYGGRGITICDRWLRFENFYADMGERPPGHTLDRADNSGNYEPGNCRWATPGQQAINTRSAKLSPADRVRVREIYAAGGISHRALGERFGVSHSIVAKVVGPRAAR